MYIRVARYIFGSLLGYIILYTCTLYTVVVVSFFTTFPALTISIRSPTPHGNLLLHARIQSLRHHRRGLVHTDLHAKMKTDSSNRDGNGPFLIVKPLCYANVRFTLLPPKQPQTTLLFHIHTLRPSTYLYVYIRFFTFSFIIFVLNPLTPLAFRPRGICRLRI